MIVVHILTYHKFKLNINTPLLRRPQKEASIRTIDLSDEACYILDTLIANNKARGQKVGDYIFVYRQKRLHCVGVLKRIYKLCDELDYGRRFTHKTRKTILSNLVNMCLQEGLGDN